jgi:ribonuclease HI
MIIIFWYLSKMAAKKKYYAVARGHKTGIYDQWYGKNGAEAQTNGYSGALFKKFSLKEDAISWLKAHCFDTNYSISGDSISGKKMTLPGFSKQKQSGNGKRKKSKKLGAPQSSEANKVLSEPLDENLVIIYTDGGCIGNPGPGGFGVVLKFRGCRKEISGGYRKTTNNRMELLACIEGLKALKKPCSVVIYSDSKYVVNAVEKGWARRWQSQGWMRTKTEPAENVDLWEKLLELCDKHQVEFKWVKGHAGNAENERCDQLANLSALKPNNPQDIAYETKKTRAMTVSEFLKV